MQVRKSSRRAAFIFIAALSLVSCGNSSQPGETASDLSVSAETANEASIDEIAASFVRLGLGIGLHDADYVDAYHGPEEWREEVRAAAPDLGALRTEAGRLIGLLNDADIRNGQTPRSLMLGRQLVAAEARIRMAQGESLSFDDETRLLYDAVAPQYDLAEFDRALAEIEALLPGDAPLHERVDGFRQKLAIPQDRLAEVFDAAIAECRRRTLLRYDLPANERFSIGYVTDKPWSGYNWYQGDFESLIEINTDFPVMIDRAIDLGCHEGYPGHHTWNVLIERDFLKGNNWIEYSIYPLFSPLSLIAEGSANFGIELAFPGEEKIEFERDVLFPLAGLSSDDALTMAALNKLKSKLSHAGNHVAREFLDGRVDREQAQELLLKYSLDTPERVAQRIRFFETYRGYVLNYNLGRDLVRAYVERAVAEGEDPWVAFERLLTTPVSASDLVADPVSAE